MTDDRTGVSAQPRPQTGLGPAAQKLVRDDIRAREEHGVREYGTALHAYNGRNTLQDLYEELLDAAVYARGLLEEQNRAEEAWAIIGQLRADNQRLTDLVAEQRRIIAARDRRLDELHAAARGVR